MATVGVEFPNVKEYQDLPEGFTLDKASFIPEEAPERVGPTLNNYTEENLFQYEMRKLHQDHDPDRTGPPGEAPSPQEGNRLAGDLPPGYVVDQPLATPPSSFYGTSTEEEGEAAPKEKKGTPSKGLLLSEDEEGNVSINAWEAIKNFMATGDEKSAMAIVSTLAGGGALRAGMAAKSELGVFGGKPPFTVIEGGLSKLDKAIDELSSTLSKSLKENKVMSQSDLNKLRPVMDELRQSMKEYTKETNEMLPMKGKPSKDTLEYLGLSEHEWKQGILKSLDKELAPGLKVTRGGKEPILEHPIPKIERESIYGQLKAAQQMYNKLSGSGEKGEKVGLYQQLYYTLKRAADAETAVRSMDKFLKESGMPNTQTDETLRKMRDFLFEHAAAIKKDIERLKSRQET
mgnify:FL=1